MAVPHEIGFISLNRRFILCAFFANSCLSWGQTAMNLTHLRTSPGPRRLVYLALLICVSTIFIGGASYIADFRDPKFIWPLFFEALFLITVTVSFSSFYKMDFAFLLFIFGAPTGILFTQIGLLVHIYSLAGGRDALASMNDLLLIFCLGGICSGFGFFLGGNKKLPHERISLTGFCLTIGLLLLCSLTAAFLAQGENVNLGYFVDLFSIIFLILLMLMVAGLSFLRPGDFATNIASSLVFAFFLATGFATLVWYEVFLPSLLGDYSSVGPLLALAVLSIAYAIIPYILYLLFLLHRQEDFPEKLGTANWHIIEAYLFWFLICYGPAALVDLT